MQLYSNFQVQTLDVSKHMIAWAILHSKIKESHYLHDNLLKFWNITQALWISGWATHTTHILNILRRLHIVKLLGSLAFFLLVLTTGIATSPLDSSSSGSSPYQGDRHHPMGLVNDSSMCLSDSTLTINKGMLTIHLSTLHSDPKVDNVSQKIPTWQCKWLKDHQE